MSYDVVRLRIESVSPILMHNPVGLMKQAGAAPERGGKKIPLPEDEARAGLYRSQTGQLYIPSDAFREAGLIAAMEVRDPTRKGRATMTRRFGASVFLSREQCLLTRIDNGQAPITDASEDWETYVKRVVVQRNGIMRGRALVRDWACELEFEYDTETIEPTLIAAIMEQAGKYPGVLDYRVGKKGPFGRFTAELLS